MSATPATITQDKNGAIHIHGGYVFEWIDAKTGIKFAIPAKDVTPGGFTYVAMYGWRKASADSHASIKSGAIVKNDKGDKVTLTETSAKAVAVKVINKRVSAIKAGTVKAGVGGRRADALVTEMVTVCRTRARVGVTKFEKDFGKGMIGVEAFALVRVRNAFANRSVKFVATNAKHADMVTRYVVAVRDTAKSNIEARSADDAIDFAGII